MDSCRVTDGIVAKGREARTRGRKEDSITVQVALGKTRTEYVLGVYLFVSDREQETEALCVVFEPQMDYEYLIADVSVDVMIGAQFGKKHETWRA